MGQWRMGRSWNPKPTNKWASNHILECDTEPMRMFSMYQQTLRSQRTVKPTNQDNNTGITQVKCKNTGKGETTNSRPDKQSREPNKDPTRRKTCRQQNHPRPSVHNRIWLRENLEIQVRQKAIVRVLVRAVVLQLVTTKSGNSSNTTNSPTS